MKNNHLDHQLSLQFCKVYSNAGTKTPTRFTVKPLAVKINLKLFEYKSTRYAVHHHGQGGRRIVSLTSTSIGMVCVPMIEPKKGMVIG
jgi:hypothetical protein